MMEETLALEDDVFFRDKMDEAAKLLKLIGNENRLLVLYLLLQCGELSVGAIHQHMSLGQSALSQHLGRMREQGLITYRRECQTLYYRISSPDIEKIVATLKDIYCPEEQEDPAQADALENY